MTLPASAAAFFDVDGTLTRTTILSPLIWYQRARLSRPRYALWLTGMLLDVPRLVWIDRRSRSRLNVVFFRRYRGLPADDMRAWHRRTFDDTLRRRLFPAALACLDEHRRQGRRVVLVTGGLDFVMRPLAEYLGAADLFATHLAERDGRFTGELAGAPIADAHKGELMREYAQKHGIDLAQSFAYTDSHGDLSMLECVGHPAAVNPDLRLRKLAAERGWPVEAWTLPSA
jgi:HAD superfamily hydrolase (TIGR01490 family)